MEGGELGEEELASVARVEGLDQALRAERLGGLREAEAELRAATAQRDAVAHGANFDNRLVCVLCCGSFSLFSRGDACQGCRFSVCAACLQPAPAAQPGSPSPAPGRLCRLCRQARDFTKRERDWARFSSFPPTSFATAKLSAPSCPPSAAFPWQRRASVELRVQTHIGDFQAVPVNVQPPHSDRLLSLRMGLEAALGGHKPSQALEDKLDEAKREILLERRSLGGGVLLTPAKTPENWEALLATAILNFFFQQDVPQTASPGPLGGAAGAEGQSGEASWQRALAPRVSLREDSDSALEETDELDSVSSVGYAHNWFLKGNRVSPFGSVRSQCSQRVPLNVPSFLKAFSQAEEEDEEEAESEAELGTRPSETELGGQEEEEGGPEFLETPKSVQCSEGELITITCRVRPSSEEETEVRWYSSRGELEDVGGRVRILADLERGYHQLEIFDAEPGDSGEVVVVAVNGVSVRTVVAAVEVRPLELAGEEPWFLDEAEGSVVGREGEELRLGVRCLGYPLPRVTFHRGQTRLRAEGGWREERGEEGHWSLLHASPSVEHSALVSALAVNRQGRAVARFALSVIPADPGPKEPLPNGLPNGHSTAPPSPASSQDDLC